EIAVNEGSKTMTVNGVTYTEADQISLNGSDGSVYIGAIKTKAPELSGDFGTVMTWADEVRTLGVRTNADNPRDAKQAVVFGAEGIGLCRTEHMFFEDERIPKIRRMILAETVEERVEALEGLLPYQKEDFKGIYKAMGERPVTIRLLDPPLHEFLPKTEEDMRALSNQFNIPYEHIVKKTIELHEVNPMLGHRGCRLAVTYPEIAEMQTKAIITAALEVKKETGADIVPEIMVPLVGVDNELKYVKNVIDETAAKCFEEAGESLTYMVGTMIEIPRAALTAEAIAEDAEFFSFGTNDLTQMGFGFSRDDTGAIIKEYVDKGVLECDPFQSLDQTGVGKLVKMAVEDGKKTRPNIKLGICGEHGGDPASIEFCYKAGLGYVSCSPFRVPIARLAAAQAVIKNR
ncbi:MAG: pyruvate, phosphate dikinase, partial [Clostridiales bacterium]|nr:pyruvate, phosphate dikinase [Clostridiales bacterium]